MTTNAKVTLWHFDKNTESFRRAVFENVYVSRKEKISKNRIKQRGFYSEDNCKIRIPTQENIEAAVGDYVYIGESSSEIPDRSMALKLVEISDNRRGASPHWRLSCGG